jgi:uncharacterized damage-inducible protein DinB
LATKKFPYEEALGDRDPIKVMSKTPRKLMRLLDDLDDDEIEQRPAPGKWNLREIVSHLADCELVWAWRLRYVYGEKNPVIQPFDQDNWAKAYKSYSLADALGGFKSMRKWNLAFVNGLKSSEVKKVYTHPERGEETLWTLVQIAAGHDLHHLALLEKQITKDKD